MSKHLPSEEVVTKFSKAANDYFQAFDGQREDEEEVWKIADYMWRCAQNRDLNDEEKDKGANLGDFDDDTEMANTGSTLFFRQINQMASQGMSVQMSRPMPFKYEPIVNTDVFGSQQEGVQQAQQWNLLARWTMKQDGFHKKSIEFWNLLKKYGNVPIMVRNFRRKGSRKVKVPRYSAVPNRETGAIEMMQTGTDEKVKEVITHNYPSLTILRIEDVYADKHIGNLQDQDCVVVLGRASASELLASAAAEEIDKDKVLEVLKDDKYLWDGATHNTSNQERNENNAGDGSQSVETDLYLVYHVFMKAPILEDEWDEESGERKLYYGVIVGNEPDSGVCVHLAESDDPDGEVSICMIHDMPDDNDKLYHMAAASVVRSNYSVECTLKNQAIDNATLVNRPPTLEREGYVRGDERIFKPNARWLCDDVNNALSKFEVRDTTSTTVPLLQFIQSDSQMALATDRPMMGQAFGGRTSAAEATNIYRNSVQPHMINIRYVLEQFLGFYARKLISCWKQNALEGQIAAITDENELMAVSPKDLFGEFDIEINIVDDYEDEQRSRQNWDELMVMIGRAPALAQGIDMHALLVEWMKARKMDYTKISRPQDDPDSASVAAIENVSLLQGVPDDPMPGENHRNHIAIHEGARIGYKGVEAQFPEVSFLDQHIAKHKLMEQQRGMGQGAGIALPQNQSEGAAMGNEMAASGGAAAGGFNLGV